MTKRIPRTTVGRFWGYVSVLVALGVSLAGNVTAAYLHSPDPTWVDIGIAGLPPLAAFLLIELANHNPWDDAKWGPRVVSVLLWVVAPASAVVSFIHLVSVVMHNRNSDIGTWDGRLNWLTAVLTALLIDGLMFGGTAALLLPKSPATEPTQAVAAPAGEIEAFPDWRGEMARLLADAKPVPVKETPSEYRIDRLVVDHEPPPAPRRPKVKATLGPQKASTERKRYPPREHPVWPAFVESREKQRTFTPEDLVRAVKDEMDKEITPAAAQTMLGRWNKEYEKA